MTHTGVTVCTVCLSVRRECAQCTVNHNVFYVHCRVHIAVIVTTGKLCTPVVHTNSGQLKNALKCMNLQVTEGCISIVPCSFEIEKDVNHSTVTLPDLAMFALPSSPSS
jgi:hypothetical protein